MERTGTSLLGAEHVAIHETGRHAESPMRKRYKQLRFERFKRHALKVLNIGEPFADKDIPVLFWRTWVVRDYRGRVQQEQWLDYPHLGGMAPGDNPHLTPVLQ